MCYGSGCLKENHMGDCTVCDFEPYRGTKYKSPCILYGNFNEVMMCYLDEEEYDKLCVAESGATDEEKSKIFDLVWERWANDEERKQIIEEIEKLPWHRR